MENTKEIIKKINADFASIIHNALNKYDVPLCSLDNSMHEEINDLYKWAFEELDNNAKVTLQDEYNGYKVILAKLDYLVTKFAYENTKFNYLVSGSQFWELKKEKEKENSEDGSDRWAALLSKFSKMEKEKSRIENNENVATENTVLYHERLEQMPQGNKEKLENDKLKFVDNDGKPMENISKTAFSNLAQTDDEDLPDIVKENVKGNSSHNDLDDIFATDDKVQSLQNNDEEKKIINEKVPEDNSEEIFKANETGYDEKHEFVIEEKQNKEISEKTTIPVQKAIQHTQEVSEDPIFEIEEKKEQVIPAPVAEPAIQNEKSIEISQDDFFVLDELKEEKSDFEELNNIPKAVESKPVHEEQVVMGKPAQPSPQHFVKQDEVETEKTTEPEISIEDIPFFRNRKI